MTKDRKRAVVDPVLQLGQVGAGLAELGLDGEKLLRDLPQAEIALGFEFAQAGSQFGLPGLQFVEGGGQDFHPCFGLPKMLFERFVHGLPFEEKAVGPN